ncbi:hypothetical protein OAB00_03880 [Akkermansiaceae bacterium]|nr:hypothetical protein [Akkermansiaceae bacterium]
MNKKIKKALMAGAAMYGASKLAGAGSDKFLASGAAGGARLPKGDSFSRARRLMTSNDAMNGIKKKSLFQKILNLGPGKNATSSKGGTLANELLSGEVMGLGDMDGAKYGKMITAKNGVYVTAKCKNGRNKATKIT